MTVPMKHSTQCGAVLSSILLTTPGRPERCSSANVFEAGIGGGSGRFGDGVDATSTIAGCGESLGRKWGTTMLFPHAGQSMVKSRYAASHAMCWRQYGQANLISFNIALLCRRFHLARLGFTDQSR